MFIISCAILEAATVKVEVLWANEWDCILGPFSTDGAPFMRLDSPNCLGYYLILLMSDVNPLSISQLVHRLSI